MNDKHRTLTIGISMLGVVILIAAVASGRPGRPTPPPAVDRQAAIAVTRVERWLASLEAALAAHQAADVDVAWGQAYRAALLDGWEPLVQVGDAAMRIARSDGGAFAHARGVNRAREAYFAAKVRARRIGSLDGTLRVADALARIGYHEAAFALRREAERMAHALEF